MKKQRDQAFIDYCIHDGYMSNFRAGNITADISSKLIDLRKTLDAGRPKAALRMVREIIEMQLNLTTQINYTGRCLGGVVDPNQSQPTDTREGVQILLAEIKKPRNNE